MTSAHSHGRFSQSAASLLLTAALLVCVATPGSAQYTVTNLVSNQTAIGANPADPDLVKRMGHHLACDQPLLGERQRHGEIHAL